MAAEIAALNRGMTLSTILRQPKGVSVGGQFASQDRTEDELSLTLGVGETFYPLDRAEVIEITVDYLARIDEQLVAADSASTDIEDGHLHGRRHAYAEIAARLMNPELNDSQAEAAAEDILNDRFNGVRIENSGNFSPREISAVDRSQLVDSLLGRADELFVDAQDSDLPADVQAHLYGRFETLSDASFALGDR